MGAEEKTVSRENWGRGNIYTRGTRLWIRYPVDGKYRFESVGKGKTQEQARRLLEKRLVEVEKHDLPAPTKELKRAVADLLDDLQKDLEARQCRSLRSAIAVLKAVRKALGDRRASSISKADITRFIVDQRQAGFADETTRRQLRLLRQAYRQQKAIPVPDFPELPKGRARDFLIAPGQQARLIAAFDDECFAEMARFYFTTGWRGREIRLLEWAHIRGDTIRLVAENSKNKEPRDFPIVGAVAAILARRRLSQSRVCPFVFHRNNKAVPYTTWLCAWDAAATKADIPGAKPHDCRRAFVTNRVNAGIDPQTVRTLSGHRSNAVFERYRIITTSVLADAIERGEQYVEQRANDSKVVSLADLKVRQSEAKSKTETRKSYAHN
jgi:integrase